MRLRYRYHFLFVAFLFACGGKHSTSGLPPIEDSPVDRDGGTGGPDGGIDGGAGGAPDGGLSGYSAILTRTPRPQGATLGENPEGDADICCVATTNLNCRSARGEADFSPARRIAVLGAGRAPIRAEIYSDADCRTFDRTLEAVLQFPYEDLWAVQVDFTPPLPVAMQISMKWRTGICEKTDCVNYTVGSTPVLCWYDY